MQSANLFNPVAHCGNHAFDLVVFAFGQRQAQRVVASLFTSCSAHRFRVVVQHHAAKQLLHLTLVHRMLGLDLVDLGHMVLGRAHAVNEFSVV